VRVVLEPCPAFWSNDALAAAAARFAAGLGAMPDISRARSTIAPTAAVVVRSVCTLRRPTG